MTDDIARHSRLERVDPEEGYPTSNFLERSHVINPSDWIWYGFPQHDEEHSPHCIFHLATRVGNVMVSTIGANFPRRGGDGRMHRVSSGAYYETLVMECRGEDTNGDPVLVMPELRRDTYLDSRAAEDGHREMCLRMASGELGEVEIGVGELE